MYSKCHLPYCFSKIINYSITCFKKKKNFNVKNVYFILCKTSSKKCVVIFQIFQILNVLKNIAILIQSKCHNEITLVESQTDHINKKITVATATTYLHFCLKIDLEIDHNNQMITVARTTSYLHYFLRIDLELC